MNDMDNMETNNNQTGGGNIERVNIFKHVFSFDNKTKNSLMNSVQYLILLILPLKIINDILEYLFENQTYSNRNNFVIIIEIIIEMILIIVMVLLIHRFITYIPTYSGKEMDGINLIQIAIMVAFYKIHTNERFRLKIDYIIKKINNEFSPQDEKKVVNVYNPLQPIAPTTNLVNTHNPSQADYLQNINPNLRSLEHQAIEQSQNQINNSNISLGLLPQQIPQMPQMNQVNQALNINSGGLMNSEPDAANNGGGGGFSSW